MSKPLTKLQRWQDYVWLVVLLAAAYFAYRVIPAIDPRSGIDGWGDLFAALIAAVKGVMVTLGAWLSKNLYWWEPGTVEEHRWHCAIEGREAGDSPLAPEQAPPPPITRRWALVLVVKDRIEWIVWLVFWSWVLF